MKPLVGDAVEYILYLPISVAIVLVDIGNISISDFDPQLPLTVEVRDLEQRISSLEWTIF